MGNKKIVGYTAGVYDMFHIGHLNLLKNAKKYCDYLIVGVNSDETTHEYKGKYPVVDEDNRRAIVDSIKYVDKTIIVNAPVHIDHANRIFAYEKFHPDLIFIGDDHREEMRWQEVDKYLRARGSRVVFLPYTESTSSTILRKKHSKKVEG